MDNYAKAIEHIGNCIMEYRQMKEHDGKRLNELLQQISGTLFYLEKYRSEVHASYQSEINRLVSSKMTVARAENEAHVKYPEMYMLRRLMDSAYTTIESIKANIYSLNRQMKA